MPRTSSQTFMKVNRSTFSGMFDSVALEKWYSELANVFNAIHQNLVCLFITHRCFLIKSPLFSQSNPLYSSIDVVYLAASWFKLDEDLRSHQ